MPTNDVATLVELTDAELDIVAAGSSTRQNSLVNLSNLVNINTGVSVNTGVLLANQANIALFSTTVQGGAQSLNLNQFALTSG